MLCVMLWFNCRGERGAVHWEFLGADGLVGVMEKSRSLLWINGKPFPSL